MSKGNDARRSPLQGGNASVTTLAAAEEWADAYRRAWETTDADAAAALFTPAARYWASPFREAHRGRHEIHDYWSNATRTQRDTVVRMGTPLVDGDQVAVEWWATWVEDGEVPVTLPGVLLLRFANDGLCRSLRENWAYASGHIEPFDGWGRIHSGNTDLTRWQASDWAASYRAAWQVGDAEGEAATFSPYAIVRTSPFREPLHGRGAVLAHNRTAYATESQQDVRFGAPIADGGTAAVEWWCAMIDAGRAITVSGCSMLSFDETSLVSDVREIWNEGDGRREPHPDWG